MDPNPLSLPSTHTRLPPTKRKAAAPDDHALWRSQLGAYTLHDGGARASPEARVARLPRRVSGATPTGVFASAPSPGSTDSELLAALVAAERGGGGGESAPAGAAAAGADTTTTADPTLTPPVVKPHRLSVSSLPAAAAAGAGVERQAGGEAGVPPPPPPPPQPQLTPSSLDVSSYLPPDMALAWTGGDPRRSTLYAWQAEALASPGVLSGRSLVFSAPTSAGKTAVAEILALRRIALTGKPALFVFPFNALCKEKADRLDRLLRPTNRRVVRLFDRQPGTLGAATVGAYVANFERGSAAVSRLLEEGGLDGLACVVVDELHMLGDPGRGFLLELLLAKLKFGAVLAAGSQSGGGGGVAAVTPPRSLRSSGGPHAAAATTSPAGPAATTSPATLTPSAGVQIVGMSATLPNVGAVAAWLGASLYTTMFRPVPLSFHTVEGDVARPADGGKARVLSLPPQPASPPAVADDLRCVAALVSESASAGHAVLVFCGTKARAQETAVGVARLLGPLPERGAAAAGAAPPRAALVDRLSAAPRQNTALLTALRCGAAFHHADLPPDARRLVEGAYATGAACMLAATSTLAAGVNLPARRVVFRDAYIGLPSNRLDGTRFAQMAGRAGRAGIDDAGDVYVLASARPTLAERDRVAALLGARPDPVFSCLPDRGCLKRAIFEAVALRAVAAPADVLRFLDCTFGWNGGFPTVVEVKKEDEAAAATTTCSTPPPPPDTAGRLQMADATRDVLRELGEARLVEWRSEGQGGGRFAPTALGAAAAAVGLGPDDAVALTAELTAASADGVVLACDLHLVFLAVPPGERLVAHAPLPASSSTGPRNADAAAAACIDAYTFGATGPLAACRRAVATRVGVDEGLLVAARHGGGAPARRSAALHRLHAALAVDALVQERSVDAVAAEFGVAPHRLAGLQEAAAAHAARASAFARAAGGELDALADLLATVERRIAAGARPELLALTQISNVRAARARRLHRAGLATAKDVAEADFDKLWDVLSGGGADTSVTRGLVARVHASAARLAEAAERQRKATEELEAEAAVAAAEAVDEEGGMGSIVEQAIELAVAGVRKRESEDGGGGKGEGGGATTTAAPPSSPPPPPTSPPGLADSVANNDVERRDEGVVFHSVRLFDRPATLPPLPCAIDAPPFDTTSSHGLVIVPPASLPAFVAAASHQPAFSIAVATRPAAPVLPRPGVNPAPASSTATRCVAGLALTWRADCVFWVDARTQCARDAVASLLACEGPVKIGFDWKGVLHTLAGTVAVCGSGGDIAAATTHPPADALAAAFVAPPLVDVRVVAWLLDPASPSVDDGSGGDHRALEGLLDAFDACGVAAAATVGLPRRPPSARGGGAAAPPLDRRMATATVAAKAWHLHARQEAELATRPDGTALRTALLGREAPLTLILARMEVTGVLIDAEPLLAEAVRLKAVQEGAQSFLEAAAAEAEAARITSAVAPRLPTPARLSDVRRAARASVDLASPASVARLLYETLKLPPPPGAVPGRSGQLPTGRAALAALADLAPARAVRAHRAATARLEWWPNW